MDAYKVIIDLDVSDYNGTVSADGLVQRARYDELKKQIEDDLSRAAFGINGNPKSALCRTEYHENPPGSGLVYFIDGTRGAGKSTFLRAAYHALPGHQLGEGQTGNAYSIAKLARLDYIDPSRLEGNEIVLLSVLKALRDIIDKHHPRIRDDERYRAFRETFKKLAGGLSLFAEDHHPLQHHDPELFLDRGLDRAGQSKELRRHLHRVLDIACELLGIEALLLAVDDADTHAGHARRVLECIRNYLDTPRLVILVTGDMELYSLLVRDHFFDNLRHSQYDQGEERRQQRVRMVDHLEDQYLLKLFPIHRRSLLKPLGSLLSEPNQSNKKPRTYVLTSNRWEGNEASPGRNPIVVIDELVRQGLRIKNEADIKLYREFLLQQPLRSLLQVLSHCAPYLSATDEVGKKVNGASGGLSKALRESLRSMALGSLYKFGVDVDALADNYLPALIAAVFELSLRDGDVDTAAYLRPQASGEDLKNSFLALAAEVAGHCAGKPSAAIRYLLGGPGSVSLFGQVLLRKKENIEREALRRQFRQYMGIGRNEDALNWARHATAILIAPGVKNSALVRFGAIGLHMRKPKGALLVGVGNGITNTDPGCADFKPIKTAIGTWTRNSPGKALPAIALSLMEVSGSGNRTYASIFNVLGLIERLLSLETSGREAKILELLTKAYPSISISCPEWERNSSVFGGDESTESKVTGQSTLPTSAENEDDDAGDAQRAEDAENAALEDTAIPNDTPDHLKILVGHLTRWLSETEISSNKLASSGVLLGKIWTRLYFSLEKVSEDRRGKIATASMMEMFALCVINAFYVEEADHHLFENAQGN